MWIRSSSAPRPWAALAALVTLAIVGGCSEPEGADDDAGADASSDSIQVDASDEDALETDAVDQGDAAPEPGPLTMLVENYGVTLERRCDFDGDGVADNSLADTGSPGAELIEAYLNSEVSGNVEQGLRLVGHIPWIDDRARPSGSGSALAMFRAVDTDVPEDLEDDFSGGESFYARWSHVDACGEPLYALRDVRIVDGVLTARDGTLPLHLQFGQLATGHSAELEGSVGAFGEEARLEGCAYVTIAELGATTSNRTLTDATLLEAVVAGGGALGLPSLPGLSPDVDLDGDGLERLQTDDEAQLVMCIDGDATPIHGADCWADPRIADAFGLSFFFEMVGAAFDGLAPGWEERVDGDCVDPPEESLWDAP